MDSHHFASISMVLALIPLAMYSQSLFANSSFSLM